MQNREYIVFAISNLRRRINTYTLLKWISIYGLFGIGIAVLLVSIGRFIAIPVSLPLIVMSVVVLGVVAGMIRGVMKFVSDIEAAKTADSKLHLQERFSTALEIMGKEGISQMAELQLEDTAKFAGSLDPKAVYPDVFPLTAKLLPLAIVVLAALFFIPPLYVNSDETSPAVMEAINKVGRGMENVAEDIDKKLLSNELRELASEMKKTGDELQQKPITKKEALKDLSNLTRKMETMEIIAEVVGELDKDITPEKKRILNELLAKLAENLRDMPNMNELSKKVIKAQKMDLSIEALKELSAALDNMRFGKPDMRSLEQMSDEVAKAKQNIGRIIPVLVKGMDSGGSQEEGSGQMGGAAPSEGSIKGDGQDSYKQDFSGQGYDSELDGQVSEKGRSLPVRSESDLKKGEVLVPYQEIYVKYRNEADDAINNDKIPWIYREQVKRYFDGIKKYDSEN